jgi:hypothetical protein
MPADPYIREKYTRNLMTARQLAREYFEKYPKDRYETSVETWHALKHSLGWLTLEREVVSARNVTGLQHLCR